MADAGFGHNFEDAMDHAEAGTQHGDDGDGAYELVGGGAGNGGLDLDGFGFERACDLIDHEPCDLRERGTEGAVGGVLITDDGHLVGDEGVVEDDEAGVICVWHG